MDIRTLTGTTGTPAAHFAVSSATLIIPLEHDPRQDRGTVRRRKFRRETSWRWGVKAGLIAPHASPEYGGLGTPQQRRARPSCSRRRGYSLLGPRSRCTSLRLNEGKHPTCWRWWATHEQKRALGLRPLARPGDIRFVLLHDGAGGRGAGSDPSAAETRRQSRTATIGDQRHQVVSSPAPTGAGFRRSSWRRGEGRRRDNVPGRHGPGPGHRDRADHAQHGSGLLPVATPWCGSNDLRVPGERHPRRAGQGLPLCAGAPGAGRRTDALHEGGWARAAAGATTIAGGIRPRNARCSVPSW